MKDAYYFSHDANARHDIKIQALILRYGMAGYGIWWVIVEMLREQEEYMLPRKQYMWASIAKETMMTPEQAEEFIEDCVNEFELLEYDDGHFFAPSLKKRMEHLDSVRKKRKKAADKRWDEQNNDEQCKCNANAMQNDAKESKVKESKVKEEYAPDITMTEEEYTEEFETFWKEYPRKVNKRGAYKAFKARKKENEDIQKIFTCLHNYVKAVEDKDEQFIMHPTTFLGANKRYEDYIKARASPGREYCEKCGQTLIDGRCKRCDV